MEMERPGDGVGLLTLCLQKNATGRLYLSRPEDPFQQAPVAGRARLATTNEAAICGALGGFSAIAPPELLRSSTTTRRCASRRESSRGPGTSKPHRYEVIPSSWFCSRCCCKKHHWILGSWYLGERQGSSVTYRSWLS
jgi:hypothetical protein